MPFGAFLKLNLGSNCHHTYTASSTSTKRHTFLPWLSPGLSCSQRWFSEWSEGRRSWAVLDCDDEQVMRVEEIILSVSSSKYFQENSLLPGEQQLSLSTLKCLWLSVGIFIMTCIKQIATSRPVVQAALLKVFTGRNLGPSKLQKVWNQGFDMPQHIHSMSVTKERSF